VKNILLSLSLLTFSLFATAQDRLFAYTYQTSVLSRGAFDLELHNTLLTGRKGPHTPYVFSQSLNQRIEMEFGLGHNLQTAFYFNSELSNYADTSSRDMSHAFKTSFSNEWKWKITDPVADIIGSGLYFEVEAGGDELELEGKLLLDKQIKKELFAFNLIYKTEIESEISRTNGVSAAEWETEQRSFDLYFGYLHTFGPSFRAGIEAKNNNIFTEYDGWLSSPLFAGPAIHYSSGKCFMNLSVLPQLTNLHKSASIQGPKDLVQHESMEMRLLIGYSF
jgi:hypothetical protein